MNIFNRQRHTPDAGKEHLDVSLQKKTPLLGKIRQAKATFAIARAMMAFSLTGTAATVLTAPGCTQESRMDVERGIVKDQFNEVLKDGGLDPKEVKETKIRMIEEGLWEIKVGMKDGKTYSFEGKIGKETVAWTRVTEEMKKSQGTIIQLEIPVVMAATGIPRKNVSDVDVKYVSYGSWTVDFKLNDGSTIKFKVKVDGKRTKWQGDCDFKKKTGRKEILT